MIFEASEFVLQLPPQVSRARRILIKPSAAYPMPYPISTSREILATIISGIREVSDADILLLEGTPREDTVYPNYKTLGYDFPRVLTLDVRDCTWVEVDNPLEKPFAMSTFWVPNVILSSDYLITVAPLKVLNGRASMSIMNLLTTLPAAKYSHPESDFKSLYSLGIDRVLADLYFTLPFDLGILEANSKYTSSGNDTGSKVEDLGKIFVGDPFQIDREASKLLGLKAKYLNLIEEASGELQSKEN
ncbi:MAG: DUF362 domain-containing protein [Dehalococcoidales bacterium]